MRDKDWQKFEDYIVEEMKQIDPYATHTKASRYGDLKVKGLHIECKDYNKKSVYNEDWMKKCIEEVPLHSDKIPLLITRNEKKKIRVHLDFDDFMAILKELNKYRRM